MPTNTEQTRSTTTPWQAGRFIDPALTEVRRQLLASPFAAIKQLQTDFYEGVLILRGKVPTFYTRQAALAIVMKVTGVEQIDDRIVVWERPSARQR